MDKKDGKLSKSELEKAAQKYPGVEINDADNDADNAKLVKERTCTLNNNPRNEGKIV